jgi:hypothetical protein
MSMSPSPVSSSKSFQKFLSLILPLMALAGTIACGGGSSTPSGGGGGGGGGGGTGANCSQPVPVSTSPQSQGGLAAGLNPIPTSFLDLHLGGSGILWPTVPFGGLRLWDTSTGWAQINTANGVYDWTNLDGFISVSQTHSVDLLYDLARTPAWISSNPNDSTCAYSTSAEGGPGQCDPPTDLNSDGSGTDAAWIAWVSAVATRYKGEIKYYEIWNEWNAQLFWVGTPAQLVRMEQDARCVVEGPNGLPASACTVNGSVFPSGTGIDTSAQIISPSPVGSASQLSAVQDNLNTYFGTKVPNTASGYFGGQFADIIGFHGYVSSGTSGFCPIPENVITVIDDMNSAITTAGETGKPWFDTEDGWSKANDENFLDQDREAAFMARYTLLQRSMGVERGYWYRWDSTQTYGGALWTQSGGPIEAVTAWDEVSKWMVGATFSTACTVNANVWQCGFTRSGGYQALAVWNSAQDCLNGSCPTLPFTVPAGGYTLYRDLTGTETSITGTTVPIGAKPILLETSTLP